MLASKRRARLYLEALEDRTAPAVFSASSTVAQAVHGSLSAADVTAGTPVQLAITTAPPASLTANNPFGLTVSVEDGFGNVATGYSGSVTLSLSSNPGSGTLQGTTSVNAVNGVATFSGLSLNTAGSGYVLQASAGNLTTATTGSLTVAPAGPAQLLITSAPPASVTAGSAFGLTVEVEDAFGNVDTTFEGPLSLTLSGDPGNGALQGTTTVNAVDGVATFSGLSLNTADSGYTLQANLGNVTGNAGSLTVTPGAAAQLAITTAPPASVTANNPFGLTVSVEDAFGNVVAGFSGTVTLSLASNPDSANLGGSLSVNVSNGLAAFTGLLLDTPGTGYTLQASSSGLSGVVTSAFNVTPDTPTQLVVTTAPSSGLTAGAPFGLTVSVEDAGGNVVAGYTGPVSLSLSSNPDNDTLQGTTSVSAVNGVATFSGLSLNIAASGDVLQASAGNLTSATTGSLTVAPGAAAQVAITTAPPSNLTAGGSFGLTVSVEDALGNVVAGYTGPVSLSLSSNPNNDTLQGTSSVKAVNGVATFSGLSLDVAASGDVLQASAGNLTTATTGSLTVAPGAPRNWRSRLRRRPASRRARPSV